MNKFYSFGTKIFLQKLKTRKNIYLNAAKLFDFKVVKIQEHSS